MKSDTSGRRPSAVHAPARRKEAEPVIQEHRKMSRAEAARRGGLAVSTNREHMATIGRKGGQVISRDRAHMARIGEKGGTARRNRSR
jgi:general stress protein YciG